MASQSEHGNMSSLLGKLGKMTSIRDTELLEQSLLKTLGPLLGVLDTSLYRYDERNLLLRVLHHHRSREVDEHGVMRMIERIEEVRNLEALPDIVTLLTDHVRMLRKACTHRKDSQYWIGYPLNGCDEVCGCFVFQRDHEVSPAEDAVIRSVLEVFSNYYDLLDSSQRDQLTGLLNRQSLERNFENIWRIFSEQSISPPDEYGRRKGSHLQYWFAVFDIDNFKSINDTYGHMIGDEVLLLASRLMTSTFRQGDLIYRFGGEEFVVIVATEEAGHAREIFERVRRVIETYSFPQVGRVTISGGFSRARLDVLPTEVLSRADRALYKAKEDGRNRIHEYEALVAAGIFKDGPVGEMEVF